MTFWLQYIKIYSSFRHFQAGIPVTQVDTQVSVDIQVIWRRDILMVTQSELAFTLNFLVSEFGYFENDLNFRRFWIL